MNQFNPAVQKIISYILLLWVFGTVACKKCDDPNNPDCPNYCEGRPEVSADFTMHEISGQGNCSLPDDFEKLPDIETNTVNDLSLVRFTAKQNLDEYYWLIGAETLKTKSVFRAYFPRGKSVPITLIGYRNPDKRCHPNDDGWDTVTKYLYCLDAEESLAPKGPDYRNLCMGWFNGYNTSNKNDTFTFGFHFFATTKSGFPNDTFTSTYFVNIPVRGKDSKVNPVDFSTFKGGYNANSTCIEPLGKADSTGYLYVEGTMFTLDSGASITFDYQYRTNRFSPQTGWVSKIHRDKFIGKRIK